MKTIPTPMTYCKLKFKINAPKPHFFIGSTVRGMLGYALKEEVCINPTMKCEGCFAAKECAFYEMYEKANETHAYRLDYRLSSTTYKFSLLLFPDLQKHSKEIERAMLKALGNKDVQVKVKEKTLKVPKKHASLLKITFETPLRMKKQNRFARENIDLKDILRSIYKRERDLNKEAYEMFKMDEKYKIISQHFTYKELTRRSNKQQKTMNMGGLMGEIVVSGVDKEVYRLLKVGEVIGVGKATVFGLGKFNIEEIA